MFKSFVSKDYFSVTLFNKDVLKKRLLSDFEQKKPFLSLLILSSIQQYMFNIWQVLEKKTLSPQGISKGKKRQSRMIGTIMPFASPAPFLSHMFFMPEKQSESPKGPWLATYSHHQAQTVPYNFTLSALTFLLWSSEISSGLTGPPALMSYKIRWRIPQPAFWRRVKASQIPGTFLLNLWFQRGRDNTKGYTQKITFREAQARF